MGFTRTQIGPILPAMIKVREPSDMQSHPAADIFPMMSEGDLGALAADIRENGLHEAIIVHEGLILDGRNRFRACQQLGINPVIETWDGVGGSPEAFVISMNLHRRHLTESQRAMIAARLANVKRGQIGGGHRKTDKEISLSDAAALMNVHQTSVSSAKKVLREGTAEEVSAVERGEVAASTIAKQIRKGQSPEKRKSKRNAPLAQIGKNPERIQRSQMQAEIWARMSDALIGLTSLPLPVDVAKIIAANPNRRRAVEERLTRSLQWLKDFDHAWRNRG